MIKNKKNVLFFIVNVDILVIPLVYVIMFQAYKMKIGHSLLNLFMFLKDGLLLYMIKEII